VGGGLGDGEVSARGTTAWRGGGGAGGGLPLAGGGGGGLRLCGGGGGGLCVSGGGAFMVVAVGVTAATVGLPAGLGEGLDERGAGVTRAAGVSVAVWPCAGAAAVVGVPAGTGRGVETTEAAGGGGGHAQGHIFGGDDVEASWTTGVAGAPAGTGAGAAGVGAVAGTAIGAETGPGVLTGAPETAGRLAADPRDPRVPLMTPLKPAMKKPPTPVVLPSVAMLTSCSQGMGSGSG